MSHRPGLKLIGGEMNFVMQWAKYDRHKERAYGDMIATAIFSYRTTERLR